MLKKYTIIKITAFFLSFIKFLKLNMKREDSMSEGSEEPVAESSDETSALMLNAAECYRSRQEHGRYLMQWTNLKRPGIGSALKFLWEGPTASIPDRKELDERLPITRPDFSVLDSDKSKSGVWVTWLGHACVLVEIEGVRILTDPVFSSKCGPAMGCQIGPTRYRDAPCDVADLPRIDVVVISHNHYDHLDVQTVRDLNEHQSDLTWLVPKGVADWMRSTGCRNVVELDWWHKRTVNNLSFCFVPAQHWSKRGAADDNKTLWGGWCVLGKSRRFYFTGDTGYDDGLFKEIGKLLGPFDLAAIPIGAYCPRWIMSTQHIDPKEALKIHKDVGAKKSIGIHWATFNLSREPYLEPREEIHKLQCQDHTDDEEKTSDDDFFTVNPGESKFLDK